MNVTDLLFLILGITGVVTSFIAIGLMFFIGKTHIKEIDKVVYGYEFPHDSIFAQMIRVPNYGGAFYGNGQQSAQGLKVKLSSLTKISNGHLRLY